MTSKRYEVDYCVSMPMYGVLNIDEEDADSAEMEGVRTLKELFPDATSIEIEMVRLIV
jgi:hypothetical protein